MPHKFPPRILAQTRTPLLTTGPDVVFVTVEDPQSPVLPSTVNNSGGLLLPQVDRSRPRSKGITLTDTTLRGLKVESKPYKVTDGAGLYVVVFHLPAPRLSAMTTCIDPAEIAQVKLLMRRPQQVFVLTQRKLHRSGC